MIRRTLLATFPALVLGTASAWPRPDPPDSAARPRPAWTTSRLRGTPEPPHPYRVERAFPKLAFRAITELARAPGLGRFFVCQQDGKVFSFPIAEDAAKADPFLDLGRDVPGARRGGKVKNFGALYGLVFHPRFERNRYCYVCYMAETTAPKPLSSVERVSRFTVDRADPPRCDPASEKVILEWKTEPGGHNGGCLCFGPDGMLYISMGDAAAPSPPDCYDTGQDISDLLASILRIDVDRAEAGKAYAVPADNPFVKTPGARPEVWAYGFRNPWKMSFDRATGDLWAGDVGWELWEMVYRVKKGGNYGWSVMEGPQSVRPQAKRGPTPILPPALAFPHAEAASITGGFVYRGKRFADLAGSYVSGDWMSRKLWATRFDGDKIVSHREIAQGQQQIICFAEDDRGELYFADYVEKGDGGIYTLTPNPKAKEHRDDFPRTLAATGLFASVGKHTPAPGVVGYTITAEPWADGARAERLVALPGESTVHVHDRPTKVPSVPYFHALMFFPKDGVLARTFSIETTAGDPKSRRRLETQVLHHDGEDWRGYSYRWNDSQTDAELVPAGGADTVVEMRDPQAPGGKRRLNWHFPGRSECLQCHNPWAGTVLGFVPAQLDKSGQLAELRRLGVLTPVDQRSRPKPADAPFRAARRLADPYGTDGEPEARARSYLHVNCAHCHQPGAGGTARIDLRFETALAQTQTLGPPMQGGFDLADARLLAPGEPYRSVVYYRMAKLGPGRMPHIGSQEVDVAGVRLVHDWLRAKSTPSGDEALVERVRSDEGRAEAIDRLLSTTTGALRLMAVIDRMPEDVRRQVVAEAAKRPAAVRDLFERFLPDEQRVRRLGTTIDVKTLLAIPGDAVRGKEVFYRPSAPRCASCHKVGDAGSTLGPELGQIGKKLDRARLLESLLDPSKDVEDKYRAYTLETNGGQVHTGVLVSRSEKEVVLRDAQDKEIRVPAAQVAALAPQKQSLMPEQLLRDLTAQEAADLLTYLERLK